MQGTFETFEGRRILGIDDKWILPCAEERRRQTINSIKQSLDEKELTIEEIDFFFCPNPDCAGLRSVKGSQIRKCVSCGADEIENSEELGREFKRNLLFGFPKAPRTVKIIEAVADRAETAPEAPRDFIQPDPTFDLDKEIIRLADVFLRQKDIVEDLGKRGIKVSRTKVCLTLRKAGIVGRRKDTF